MSASVRFLGMWLDTRLTWKEHIDKIVSKCKRVLNVMKCMAGQEWGAVRGALQTVYIAMIRICARLWKYSIWVGGKITVREIGQNSSTSIENLLWGISNNTYCSNASRDK